MLEIQRKQRNSLESKESVILTSKKINELFNKMAVMLDNNTTDYLRRVVNLSESVFYASHFVETFKGEALKIANYNIYHNTVKFAKKFFTDINGKNILKISETDDKTVLELFCEEISIFRVKFACDMQHNFASLPINFDFVRNESSYEELIEYFEKELITLTERLNDLKARYPDYAPNKGILYSYHAGMSKEKMLKNELALLPDKITTVKRRMEQIIKLGEERLGNIGYMNQFFEEYKKDLSIDLKGTYSWYDVHEYNLKEIF